MKFISAFSIFFLISSLTTAFAADDFSTETVKATPLVTGALYMLEGAGGNVTASIGSDGTLLVDDDFAEMADKLKARLRELKGDSPRIIVNTHFHYDHTGANQVFGSHSVIIATDETRSRLMKQQTLWHQQHPAYPAVALPVVTFSDQLKLHFNADDIQLLHLPHGHTDGDTIVLFSKNKVASLGDLYFSGMYPIFHPEHEGSLKGLTENLHEILALLPEDVKLVPGHGPLSNKAELRSYVAMIEDSTAIVKRGMDNGKSLQEIQKKGLPQKWEPYSHGYRNTDQWIASIYESLKR